MRGRTSLKAIEGEGGRSVLEEEDEEDAICDPTGGGEGVKKKEPALGFTAMQLQPFPAVSRVGLDCTSGGGARTQVALQPSHPTPHRPRRPHPGRLRRGEEEEARKELRNGSLADKDQEQTSKPGILQFS